MADQPSNGSTSASESDDRKRLADLDTRLRVARDAHEPEAARESGHREMGVAYRVLVELIAGLVVGGVGGWWLDKWLDTQPAFLIILLLLGFAGGGRNAWRAIQVYQAGTESAQSDPSKKN